ncbi:NAD(P)-dependent oxidoreductase [Rhodococcus sp. Chr-9]|uniref:NAD(P)-dependent oxidoreductase n=1 Tax=Rhodococcus sp. Chr-9 TaxID=713612 RepID=UPI002285D33B|nr:NAD(P)-dependent oxidoreductase [Rhodococcus sp. Chr-9]
MSVHLNDLERHHDHAVVRCRSKEWNMTQIAWIGLGRMGLPMASHLKAAGHDVLGIENYAAAAERARAAGFAVSETLEAANGAEVIFSMLPTAADVRSVYLGADGLFASLRPGTIVVDSSTIDVATARLLAEDAAAHQLRFLDAPVSGGVKGAEAATLTFMVGGDKDTLEAVMPILEPMSGRVISAGGAGTGQAAKIVNNMIMGVSTAATCEGILLAQRIGLDPSVFFEIATTSTCDSWVIRTLFPAPGIVATAPSSDGYAAGFMTKLMVKDLALAVEAAKQTATPATVTETALAAYADAMNNGFGELDCTSLYLSMSEIADEMARTADSQASA